MEITVRASSLSGYFDCQRRWAARQLSPLLRDIGYSVRAIRPSIGAAVGSGAHSSVAHDLQHKLEKGELANWSEVEQIGVAELQSRIQEEGVDWDDVTPSLSDAQRTVARLARSYRLHTAPNLKPFAVERRIKAKHPTGLILSGQQDVVIQDAGGRHGLRDLKTGKRRAANWAQYGAYSRLLRSHKMPVETVTEDYLARVPLDKEQPPPVPHDYDLAACEQATESVMTSVADRLKAFHATGDIGVWPANPSSSLCSERFCPAWGTTTCPFGRKR